ncbi:peptide/nickel transport system ATP-binding protein [Fontibacillus panacisegetis]|uniref:Peptide/nickel transport system ATP-binding protein n=1 Tax=Fontibacillus panacisegetis TaxID=670482 RepID=A0A1G7TYI9_9BACL|nr:ABC transporter ATP-binding protein [Fontibacillus panacisegetis]SDG39809.1 peptide/nickel transport system ATP-binding protein [Fontibacillus panacisegetis]
MELLLEVDHLQIAFQTDQGELISVDEVSFELGSGETIAIVGESGCGKSVTSLSIMGLLGTSGSVIQGEIRFNGSILTDCTENQLRRLRGSEISMIFQEPMTSLNPVIPIGEQIAETVRLHQNKSRKEAKAIAVDMLRKVGIPRPEAIIKEYPHALSGGMRQRVMIAMALICKPKLLIADEPTTALDVTIQAQILELMKQLQQESGAAILLVTHDLGVVAEMADQVIVMYAGQVVETADVFTLFRAPQHPYTQGLMKSIPRLDQHKKEQLFAIPGAVPSLKEIPSGCRFHPRCPLAVGRCEEEQPELISAADGHRVRCWMAGNTEQIFVNHTVEVTV